MGKSFTNAATEWLTSSTASRCHLPQSWIPELREFAEENIFKPLGMTRTKVYDDHNEIVKNRAASYLPRAGGGFQIAATALDMVGDGNVFTCVEDLFLWDQNFYNNKLGKGGQGLINQALTPGTLNSGEKIDYAFGLVIGEYRGLRIIEHGGAFVGYRAMTMRFPDQKFSVVMQCNLGTMNPSNLLLVWEVHNATAQGSAYKSPPEESLAVL